MPHFLLESPCISVICYCLCQLGKRCRMSRLANPCWISLTEIWAFLVAFWLLSNCHHTCDNRAQVFSALLVFYNSLILHWIRLFNWVINSTRVWEASFSSVLLQSIEWIKCNLPVFKIWSASIISWFLSIKKCISKEVHFLNLLRVVLGFVFVCSFVFTLFLSHQLVLTHLHRKMSFWMYLVRVLQMYTSNLPLHPQNNTSESQRSHWVWVIGSCLVS